MNHSIEVILAFLGSGLGTTLLTEAVSWLNKKLAGTPARGLAPLILSGCAAFFMAMIQVRATGIGAPHSWHDVAVTTGAIWIASQVFFHIIIKNVDALHVTGTSDPLIPLT